MGLILQFRHRNHIITIIQMKWNFRLSLTQWQDNTQPLLFRDTSIWPPFPKHFTYNPALFSIVTYVCILYTEVTYKSADMMYVPDTMSSRTVQFNLSSCHIDTNVGILINRVTAVYTIFWKYIALKYIALKK